MQRQGISVDVSHLNEAGFWDLFAKGERPPMASHSCCRALCDHVRNLTDDQIRAMIQYGGYIGVNFYPRFSVCGLQGGQWDDCPAYRPYLPAWRIGYCRVRQRFRRHRSVARRRAESGGAAESADGAAQLWLQRRINRENLRRKFEGVLCTFEVTEKTVTEAYSNRAAKKGQGTMSLAGCRDSVPAGAWGNAPTPARAARYAKRAQVCPLSRRQRSVPAH